MAAANEIVCEPCEQNDLTILANIWCNDCGEGYCNECVKSHKVIKTMRNHHMISIEDYIKTSSLDISEICPEHSKSFAFFCVQHDSILCLNCFQSKHSKCEIVDLAEASKGSKTSTAIVNFEKEVSALIEQLGESIGTENSNLSSLKNQELAIRSEVNDVRSKINEQLDKLQTKIISDLKAKFDNNITVIENRKEKLEHIVSLMNDMKGKIGSLKEFASDKQTFIGIRQKIKNFQKEKESAVVALYNCSSIQLNLKVHDNLQSILDMTSFGDIRIDKTNYVTQFQISSESQASLDVQPFTDISKICLIRKNTIQIGKNSEEMSITSCVLMPNKKMVFVDNFGKKLIVHNSTGKHRLDISLLGNPFDITAIREDHVAVTSSNEQKIEIFDIDCGLTVRRIACKFMCWGLCFADEKLYVSDTTYKTVHVFDTVGTYLAQISLDVTQMFNISIFKDRVYLIGIASYRIYAFEKNKIKLWGSHDKRLCKPKCFRKNYSTSLTTDNHGNIFAVLPDSSSVVVVSHDGKSTRDILDKSNNHNHPSGVSFLKDTNQLLVCNALDRYAALYDVKHSPRID